VPKVKVSKTKSLPFRADQTSSDLTQELITTCEDQQKYQQIDQEIHEYAAQIVGTSADLDPQLDATVWEQFILSEV
jgi:hypothetical protein